MARKAGSWESVKVMLVVSEFAPAVAEAGVFRKERSIASVGLDSEAIFVDVVRTLVSLWDPESIDLSWVMRASLRLDSSRRA